jgi:TIR domain
MQVFISYAHTPADTDLARYLAARLRDVKIQAWLDESALKAGGMLQADIERAIAESDAGVFLMSQSWAASEWTAFELEQFDRHDPRVVKRIPIFRLPRERLQVPPALIKMKGVVWLEDDGDGDARFWELFCALTDAAPGPAEEWSTAGRKLTSSSARIPPPRLSKPVSSVRPSLRCNRALQWKTVDDLATDTSHEIILVPGVVGQAHEHFLERVQRLLRMDPPRSVATVDWPTRPRSRDEFREALARALNVTSAALAEEMGLRLTHANIVLLHPCLRARFVDETLVKYYTVWLPELIEESQPRMNVKCLQPVEWPPESGVAAQLLTWMRLRGTGAEDGKVQAEQLMTRVRTGAGAVLPAIRLHELNDITRADLDEFCDVMKLNDAQKTWLLSRITMRGPKTPREVFQAIDDYLPDARSVT